MKKVIPVFIIIFSFCLKSYAQNKDVDVFYEVIKKKLPKKQRKLLNSKTFEELKKELFSKVDSLDFKNYKLQSIPLELFDLKNLEYLNLSNCSIQQLPSEIKKLKNLKTLIWENAELQSLPKEVGKLQKLENLFLSLKMEDIIQSYIHIEGFLSNGLNELPKEFGKLKNLKTLTLQNIALIKLPKTFKKLQKLEKLEIYFHTLTTLPKEIISLQNLKELYLSQGKLQILPKEIEKLEKLEILNLDKNYLNFLPKEIGNLKNLKRLTLHDNQLKSLPKEVANLRKLEKLILSMNRLKTLPKELHNLKSLKFLDLQYNLFETELKVIQELKKSSNVFFNSIFEIFADSSDYYLKSKREFKRGNYQKSYDIMLKVCQLDSTNFRNWEALSWHSIFVGRYDIAIQASQKSLYLDKITSEAEKAMALAYLLRNEWNKAKEIYLKWKDKTRNSMPLALSCNESFLQDIFELESAGIKHKDFEKVKKLLKK